MEVAASRSPTRIVPSCASFARSRRVQARTPRLITCYSCSVTSGVSYQRKLKLLDGATRLDDLAISAGNRLERLKGHGRCSIRVNDQYRVSFRWESGHA